MSKFFDYVEELPVLFKNLENSQSHKIEELKESKLKEMLGSSLPVAGVYVMYDKNVPMYVGRSKTIAQKIGVDEKALSKNQATVSRKIMQVNNYETMKDARNYLYENYTVKFIPIENEVMRSLFQIYVATKLETPFNSFMEN